MDSGLEYFSEGVATDKFIHPGPTAHRHKTDVTGKHPDHGHGRRAPWLGLRPSALRTSPGCGSETQQAESFRVPGSPAVGLSLFFLSLVNLGGLKSLDKTSISLC